MRRREFPVAVPAAFARIAGPILVACALAIAVPACRPAVTPPDPLDPASLSPDVRIEQSLWLRIGGRSFVGRGVVRKQGPLLDLLVLSPTGNRLLTIRADGDRVTTETRVESLARLDARALLADVRWAFFGGCPRPPGAPADRTCTVGRTQVRDSDDPRTGDLWRRELSRHGFRARLDFPAWTGEGADRHPQVVHLANERLGYEWEVRVDAWTVLPP